VRLDVRDRLATVMDGAMVDLKCLDPAIHRVTTGHGNDAVLASIAHRERSVGCTRCDSCCSPGSTTTRRC
jgi:pyruvate-formate lyase-activating enzyme